MGLYHSPKIVTDGLRMYFDAAGARSYPGSGITWTDISGNGNVATLYNGVSFDSNNLGNFSFDGVNDYIYSTSTFNVSGVTQYSMSMWVYFDSSNTGTDSRFFWHGNYGALMIRGANNILSFYIRNAVDYAFTANAIMDPYYDKWVNIAATYNVSEIKLYMNSELEDSATGNSGGIVNDLPTIFYLGYYPAAGFATACKIANCMVYDKVLTQSEIQQNFNSLRGRFGV